MKILTWNINGIRSVKRGQSLKKLFDSLEADIICLQETKVTREMLGEETACVEGYNAYFSFSKVRSGYSGVATFCRDRVTPIKAEDTISLSECILMNVESLNAEGRSVLTEHVDPEGNHVVIMNLYCPRADLENKERTEFKLKFYSLVEAKCRSLTQEGKHVVVLGDFNVSHKLIDHCDPDDPEIFDSNPSRQWLNSFIWDCGNIEGEDMRPLLEEIGTSSRCLSEEQSQSTKFIDSFRYFYPNQESAFTCWSTLTGARQTNYGTRIDYIFSNVSFFKKEFTDCVIRPDIEGSDHCPVIATLKSTFENGGKPPPLCTKYMPEFAGKQQKLHHFFSEKSNMKLSNSSEKRSAPTSHKSQAKRLKTSVGNPQGKISQFFDKKPMTTRANSSKQNSSSEGIKMVMNRSTTGNQKDAANFEIAETDLLPEKQNKEQSSSCNNDSGTVIFSQKSMSSSGYDSTPPNSQEQQKLEQSVVSSWKSLLKGPPPAPLCSGHKEPCVLRTVKNNGPNHGKKFYCCARPQGHSTNKEARCNYFTWVLKR